MTTAPPFPSFTKIWHNDTYPALSPDGKAMGKTVVITGASGGIGRATALSFAKAGASRIALLGRREDALQETERAVHAFDAGIETSFYICDSIDTEALQKAAASIGPWEVLILNAGVWPSTSNIEDADIDTWWSAFETHVKGSLVTAQAFLTYANKQNPNGPPTIISTNAALTFTSNFPVWSGSSAYTSSKLALAQIMQHLTQEHPDINVVSVHPGIVDTAMLTATDEKKAYMREVGLLDTLDLTGNFMVWASGKEAGEAVRGKFVFANWDVEELTGRKEELQSSEILRVGLLDWPFDKK